MRCNSAYLSGLANVSKLCCAMRRLLIGERGPKCLDVCVLTELEADFLVSVTEVDVQNVGWCLFLDAICGTNYVTPVEDRFLKSQRF